MDKTAEFAEQVRNQIGILGMHPELRQQSLDWMVAVAVGNYSYNFSWLGRPVIQYPQDMVALQELIWRIKPDCIIETGIAHGGSLMLSASMLMMLDYCDAMQAGTTIDPRVPRRRVLGVDIDIRSHNRAAIEAHPLSPAIEMIQGSSIDPAITAKVADFARKFVKPLVILDSNHTHDHVLAELEAYAPLTGNGSYCCVFDTLVEDMPEELLRNAPWGKGNNPKTAVHAYLDLLQNESRTASDGAALKFTIDKQVENKLLITVAPDGFLLREDTRANV